jgi:hypothetical protein
MEKSEKKDRTVLVAIIGSIGVIAAAFIAKIDLFIPPEGTIKTEEIKQPNPGEQVIATQSPQARASKKNQDKKNEMDLRAFQVCFEKIEGGEQLKDCEVMYKGYGIRSKIDNNGCTNIPKEIINNEKSISSFTVRATLSYEDNKSEEVEIGLTEPSNYKVKFKK